MTLAEFMTGGAMVTLGAMVGTPARFFISGVVARRFGEVFPWGTLVVNVSGCLIIGIVAALLGSAIARGFGWANTPGVDWLEIIIQVVLAAIGVVLTANLYARRRT